MDEKQAKRLEAIKKNRICKRLPNDATKQEIIDAHKVKMAAKVIVRNRLHEEFKDDFERYKQYMASKMAESQRTGRSHAM